MLVGGETHGAIGFSQDKGEVVWKTPPLDVSYAAPTLQTIGGVLQMVYMAPTEVLGVSLEDGEVLWRFPHKNRFSNNCAGPWWDGKELMVVSSQADAGSRTLRILLGDEGFSVEEVAYNSKMGIFHSNALLKDSLFFGSSGNFLVAYDYAKGEELWRERGYPKANLLAVDDKTLILDENGQLSLARLSADGVETIATYQPLDKPAWTAPVLIGTRLYARNQFRLVALDLGVQAVAEPAETEGAESPAEESSASKK